MQSKYRQRSVKRIVASFILIFFFFSVLFVRLIYLQVISAKELSERQTAYMTKNIAITATRGDIYDANMTLLAKDASCSQIIVYPNSVKDPEALSAFLSAELGLDYESVHKKASNTKMDYLTIKKGVDNDVALRIRAENFSGVEVLEDKKRYYTDSTSAQYILGFVGADHTGRYGIESVFNKYLKGADGTQTVLVDSLGRKIESSVIIKQDGSPGQHVVLSSDSRIQYFTEKWVLAAYLENSPKRVVAIVSRPKTGEILAMAAYPSFSLSDPWEIDSEFLEAFPELADSTPGEKQLAQWQNPAVSYNYEPGSTFKAITVASALEEGVVNLHSTFTCAGSLVVSGVRIKCAVYPRGHGTQDLAKAVENSCNPAMMTIAMRMGADKFYDYLYAFGFGQRTGVDLDGEEGGIVRANQNIKLVDFATMAFGQGIAVTPIQMIMGVNAVINGGILYEPVIVSKILDPVSGKAVKTYPPTAVRQVISESTSSTMRDILYQSGRKAIGETKYRIGGKTGTAQKFIDGRYAQGKNVASFYGFAPYDDPEISVIFIVDEYTGSNVFGSTAAAPYARDMLTEILDYMHPQTPASAGVQPPAQVLVPDLRGKSLTEARMLLEGLGLAYELDGQAGIVTAQDPVKAVYEKGMVVKITLSGDTGDTVLMPDLSGMSVTQARDMLDSVGLEIEADGGGFAYSQSPPPNTPVKRGSAVTVRFKYVK